MTIDNYPAFGYPTTKLVTSTTRPATPIPGQIIYELDTARLLVWNGSAWQLFHEDTGWTTLPLLNGWVSYDNSYGPPRYRKKAGVVYVQGLIKSGTIGTNFAQLPVGFRPTIKVLIAGSNGEPSQYARFDVNPDGTMTMITSLNPPTWFSVYSTFPADQ